MADQVYLIQCLLTKAYKIGVSCNPEGRLRQLQTACPGKLMLVATIPGGAKEEAELHARFAPRRLIGEWFRLTEEEALLAATPQSRSPLEAFCDGARSALIDLSFILSEAIGFGVCVHEGDCLADRGRFFVLTECVKGIKGYHYSMKHELSSEWAFYDQPTAAAASFLDGWLVWLRDGGDPN